MCMKCAVTLEAQLALDAESPGAVSQEALGFFQARMEPSEAVKHKV